MLGGTPEQVENAAEIGMEHNLGLTCDPDRRARADPVHRAQHDGAVKAINAARMALRGDGIARRLARHGHRDDAQTGADMRSKYKETARGGLAVNVVEC